MSSDRSRPGAPDLDALYGAPSERARRAITNHLTDFHLEYLKAASFFCVATASASGLDASPRGGAPGFVHAIDRTTIMFPDWPGNNLLSSMRNLVEDDRIALLFLFPGLDIFMRINGHAHISTDRTHLEGLMEGEKIPKVAVIVAIDEVLFHCGRAINRAKLWEQSSRIEKRRLPSAGTMLKVLAELEEDPHALDELYDHAMKSDLY